MSYDMKPFFREPSRTHQCIFLYDDGRRCRAHAMHNEFRCFRHRENYMPPVIENEPFEIPHLNDRNAIQQALARVAAQLACNRMELKRAGLLAYILQVASSNLAANNAPEPLPAAETVPFDPEESATPEEIPAEPAPLVDSLALTGV